MSKTLLTTDSGRIISFSIKAYSSSDTTITFSLEVFVAPYGDKYGSFISRIHFFWSLIVIWATLSLNHSILAPDSCKVATSGNDASSSDTFIFLIFLFATPSITTIG